MSMFIKSRLCIRTFWREKTFKNVKNGIFVALDESNQKQ